MQRVVEIPSWMHDVLTARSQASGMSFDEVLAASLDMTASDLQAEVLGWAVAHGSSVKNVARRMAYSRSSVEKAAVRYRDRP